MTWQETASGPSGPSSERSDRVDPNPLGGVFCGTCGRWWFNQKKCNFTPKSSDWTLKNGNFGRNGNLTNTNADWTGNDDVTKKHVYFPAAKLGIKATNMYSGEVLGILWVTESVGNAETFSAAGMGGVGGAGWFADFWGSKSVLEMRKKHCKLQ